MELNISILKDELKSLIDDTRFTSSESKTAITALYGILGDKDNIKYNLITKYYEELSKYYKNLYTLLKNFIVEFIEVNNDEYKLKELNEQSSILQKRKNDAIEIIKYGILLAMIQPFYKFDESISKYYDLFEKIDVGYKEVDSNYNKQKSFLDNIYDISEIVKIGSDIKDIKDDYKLQKLYFLKFIYIFIKTYISLIKSGKEPLVSLEDLEKIFTIIKSFNDAYKIEVIETDNDKNKDLKKLFSLIYLNIKYFYYDKKKYLLVNNKNNIQYIYASISKVYTLSGDITAEQQLIDITTQYDIIKKENTDIKKENTDIKKEIERVKTEIERVKTERVITEASATEDNKKNMELPNELKEIASSAIKILQENSSNPKQFFEKTFDLAKKAVSILPINDEAEKDKMNGFITTIKNAADKLLIDKNKTAAKKQTKIVFKEIVKFVNKSTSLKNIFGETKWFLMKRSFVIPAIRNINDEILLAIDKIKLDESKSPLLPQPQLLPLSLPIPQPIHVSTTSGGKNTDDDMKVKDIVYKIEKWKEPVYEAIILKEIMNIGDNEPETSEELKLTIKKPSMKISIKGSRLTDEMNFFDEIVKKLRDKKLITSLEMERFNNIENKIENIETTKTDKKQELLEYIKDTKKQLEEQNINIEDANIIDTTKILLDFKKVADIIKKILIGLTVICIIIYIVVLLISIYNLINLLIKVIVSIIYLFYNTAITNNDTLSYTTKRIIKCTKDNYSDDIFNVLNEQLTALSIFNTNLYIIYILLGYVILYLLYFIYTSVFSKYYLLIGTIKDIDPNFTLLTTIAIIFVCSFVHLLIYKFLFKSICLNKYKEINLYEENIDNQIKNILSTFDQDEEYNTTFYNLLTDTTKRSEIDTIFQNKVLELQDDTKNNLTQFLLIYDIYIYFEEFIYLSDVKKIYIKKYFDELNKGNIPSNSFISFLDINERKLIKPYHEDLPFYKQIPTDKIENYKKINDTIGDLLANINKSIIKYSGTFYPFLFTCIYIIIICIYNFVCVYLILSFIAGSKNEELFPAFIYKMADKFMDVSRIIYNLFNK